MIAQELPVSSQGIINAQFPVEVDSDPTADVVDVTFLDPGAKPDGTETWHGGSWAAAQPNGAVYNAQCLVGLSPAVVLALGDYDAWIRIHDLVEMPVLGPYPINVF